MPAVRRRRRAPPAFLAPCGPPALPRLSAVPRALHLHHDQPGVVELARSLVASGYARRRDWDPAAPAAGRLVEAAVARTLAHLNRRTPELLPVCAFVHPWSDLLERVGEQCDPDDRRWVLGIDCEETYRLCVGPLERVLGERATAVVLHRLRQHAPLCTGDAEDLEWIIDGWEYDDRQPTEEVEEIRRRAEEAAQLRARLDHLLHVGYTASADAVAHPRIRRLLGLLAALALRSPPTDDTAWRLTESVEWSLPTPAVHLVWEDGCALSHALDEAEYLNQQDGSFPVPQQMWLLDPADPESAEGAWSRWLHALRLTRATCLLIAALEAVSSHEDTRP